MIDAKEVGKYVQDALLIMQRKYDFKPRGLSEILSLRRFVVESLSCQSDKPFMELSPDFEAVAGLLREYYGIDFTDLHRLDNGRVQIGMFSRLVSRDGFTLDPEFPEYLRRKQEQMYLP